jgi:hypothetical protein
VVLQTREPVRLISGPSSNPSATKVKTRAAVSVSMCSLMAHRRDLILFGLAAVALLPISVQAERERDHDRARRAVERGEALPLADILAREVVGVSFERKKDRWIYEFKVIVAGGRLVEVYVDAASAEILKREEH